MNKEESNDVEHIQGGYVMESHRIIIELREEQMRLNSFAFDAMLLAVSRQVVEAAKARRIRLSNSRH